MRNRVECPVTGDKCINLNYCGVLKQAADNGQPPEATSMGRIYQIMPSEVTDVISDTFCADEHIDALVDLSTTHADEDIRQVAVRRAGQIVTSMSFFNKELDPHTLRNRGLQ